MTELGCSQELPGRPSVDTQDAPSRGLTKTQANCLAAIKRLTVDGVPPTLAELTVAMDCNSKSGVHRILSALRARGAVDWVPRRARSIRILGDDYRLERVISAVVDRLYTEPKMARRVVMDAWEGRR